MRLLLVLAGMVLLIGFFSSKIRIWKTKQTLWLTGIYFTCGLGAFIYLLVLSSHVEKATSDEQLLQQLVENEQLVEALSNREFDALKDEHLQFSETFEATAENIKVLHGENSYYLPVVVSWNDSPDNKIVASYYETPLYLNRINMAPFLKTPELKWQDNQLFILDKPSKVEVKSIYLSGSFLNFSGYSRMDDPLNELIGHRILHLNVPRQFNIIGNSGW